MILLRIRVRILLYINTLLGVLRRIQISLESHLAVVNGGPSKNKNAIRMLVPCNATSSLQLFIVRKELAPSRTSDAYVPPSAE